MSRYSLKGTIGQLIYDGETQIKLPNDAIDLIILSKKKLNKFGYFNKDLDDNKYFMLSNYKYG
jgi:hypothetical protein